MRSFFQRLTDSHAGTSKVASKDTQKSWLSSKPTPKREPEDGKGRTLVGNATEKQEQSRVTRPTAHQSIPPQAPTSANQAAAIINDATRTKFRNDHESRHKQLKPELNTIPPYAPSQPPLLPTDQYPKRKSRLAGYTPSDRADKSQHVRSSSEPAAALLSKDGPIPYSRVAHTLRSKPLEERSNRDTKLANYPWNNEIEKDETRRAVRDSRIDQRDMNDGRKRTTDNADRRTKERSGEEIEGRVREKSESRRREKRTGVDELQEGERTDKYSSRYRELDNVQGPSRRREIPREDKQREREERESTRRVHELERDPQPKDRTRTIGEPKELNPPLSSIPNGIDPEPLTDKRSRRERKEPKREPLNVEQTDPSLYDAGRDPHRIRREASQSNDTRAYPSQQPSGSRLPRPEEQDTPDSSPFHSSDHRRRPEDQHSIAPLKERHPSTDPPTANGTTSYALKAYAVPQSDLNRDDERRRSKRQSRSGKIPTQISGDGRLGDKIQQEQYGRVESSAPLSSRLDGFYGGAAASLDLRPQVPHSVLPVSIRAGQGPPDPPTHEAFPKSALPPTGWAPSQAPSTATYGRTSVYQSAQPAKYQGSHRVVPVSLPEVRNDALPNPVVVHPTGVAVTDTAGQSSSRYTKYEPSIMTPQQHLHHTLPEATMNTGRGIPKPVTSERGHRKKSRKVHSTDDRRLIPDVRPPYPTEKNGAHSRGQSLDDHRAIPSIMSPPLQLLSVSQNTEASQHKRPTDQILTAIPLKEPTRSGQEPSSANFVNSFEVPLATGVSRPTISEEPKVSAMNGGSISADARHIGNTLLRPPSSAGLRPETEKSRRHHKESKEEPKRISPKRVPSQLITQPPIGDPNQGHIMGPSANLTTEPKPASASQMPYVLLPEQPPLFLVNGSVSHTGQYPSEHTPQQIIAQASDRSTAADPIPTYVQQPEWRPQPHTREPSTDAPPLDRQRQDSTKGAQNGTPITSHPGPPPPTPPYQVWTPARDNHNPKLQPDTQSTQPPKTPFRPEIRHKGLAEILSSPHPKDPGSTKPSPTTHHELTPTTTNTTPPGRLPQHDIAEHNPHGHAHYVSTSSNPVNVGPATLPEVQIASRVPPSPVVTSHPTHSHHSRKVSEGSIHPDARTPVEGRGKYSPAHNTPRPSPNMDADQKTPASPGHNSSWSRRRGAQALQEQANHAPTSSSSRLPTSVIDPTHPYQAEVALQVHEKDHGVALASPMPRFVRIHPDQYPLANPSAEPTSQPATQPSKVEHSSQHKSKRHTRDSSSKNHSPPGAIPGTVSTQKPLATNGISPSAAAQQALPPKFATSPRAIPLSRIASDESGLRTPSSLAMSNLQPTVSRASLPEGRSWSKGGLLNKLLSRGTKPEPNPTPEIWVPPQAKQVAPVPQPNGSRPSLDSVRAQTTSRRPLPATVGKNQGSIFTPFKYLKSKRNNSMSAVSIQAQHGTPTNTVIGSPTASMHSTAAPPIIPPPLRDPIVAADRWTRTAEIRKKPDGKTRRPRPGVTFDIAEEDSPEAGRRPKPTRSKKRSSTSTTTTPQDNPKHHA